MLRFGSNVNSLVDEELINALYNASKNNVRVELIVRGYMLLETTNKRFI